MAGETTIQKKSDSLDNTKERVMSANNAHEIYEHIKSLGNDPKHRQRWIWELMQNAQDVAKEDAVSVSIEFDNNEVTFTHDGLAFTEEDITHLIYHGSSKPGLAGKTGKFGTGFMTTHLLSKKVKVMGSLVDGRSFNFTLDREAVSGDDMLRVLDNSWAAFKKSINVSEPVSLTSFTYLDLIHNGGFTTVENVLSALPNLLPAVMAFSGVIKNVKIDNNGKISEYSAGPGKNVNEVKVMCTSPGIDTPTYHVLLIEELPEVKAKIAIPIDDSGNISKLDKSTPRLYITFPLVGTDQAFPLPFLIHSQRFEPSKEREKIWISSESNTPETRANKEVLEAAFGSYFKLCGAIATPEPMYGNIHLLANLGRLPSADWLDQSWYKEQLVALFSKLDLLPLLTSATGSKNIPMSSSLIPYSAPFIGDEQKHAELWQAWKYLKWEYIPAFDQSNYWLKIIDDRSTFFDNKVHATARSLKDCCIIIDQVVEHKIDNISLKDIDASSFITYLVKVIEKFKEQTLWAEYAVLPNQDNKLVKSGSLQREADELAEEIGVVLKNISSGLDINTRELLLDSYIKILSPDHQLQVYKRSALVATLVQKVKNAQIAETTANFQLNTKLLLEWLLQNDRFTDVVGFPIYMQSSKWDKIPSSGDALLCPPSLWPASFHLFNELFPSDYIIHEDNAFVFAPAKIAQKLTGQSWILYSPLFTIKEVFKEDQVRKLVVTREDKEKLADNNSIEWIMGTEVSVSKLAYFTAPKDKNVIDGARKSIRRTQLLLEFLVEVLLTEDQVGFTKTEIELTAGTQAVIVSIYPADYFIDIKGREWIKQKGANTYANSPSVEALTAYFNTDAENQVLYKSLQRIEVSRLLHFLNIGVGDLLRNIRSGDNEDEKMSWDRSYVAILMNSELTPSKVTEILGDQDLLQAYEEKKRINAIRKKNQEVGTAVEEAFEEAIVLQPGYKVRRDAIGSDYVIDFDFEHYLLIDRPNKNSFTIEIKSSRSTLVKMTGTQGSRACNEKESYVLCVVPLNGDDITARYIINHAKFITNIALQLEGRVTNVRQIRDLKNSAVIPAIGDNIWTDIEGMEVRYVIGQNAWLNDSDTVLSFIDFIKQKLI